MRRGRIHLLLLCWLAVAWTSSEDVGARNIAVRPETGEGAIQRAVNQALPGDTVLVPAGVYRGEHIRFPRSGLANAPITLKAAGSGVVIKGSREVTGWRRLPGAQPIFRKDAWPYAFGRYDEVIVANPTSPAARALDARFRARNQVLVDGVLLEEVPVRRLLAPGTFFVDRTAKVLDVYLVNGRHPATATIEVAVTDRPLLSTNGESYIHIEGIAFQHGANRPQDAALVQIAGGQSCALIACRVSYAAGAGVSISGEHHRLERCILHNNGQLGLHSTTAVNCSVTDSETSFNNTHPGKRYDVGWEAGGMKISLSRSFRLERHLARYNTGSGIWFDINNHAATILGCTSHHNGIGIHYEISYSALIANNLCYANSLQGQPVNSPYGQGIYLSSSAGCRVYHNTCYSNGTRGIEVAGAVRGDGAGRTVASYSNHLLNNVVADNQRQNPNAGDILVAHTGGDALPVLPRPRLTVRPNRLDYNLYFRSDGSAPFRRADGRRSATLAGWQAATGQDAHSVWGDPHFTDAARGNFILLAGSPAIDRGAAVGGVTTDQAGGARPLGGGADIGALEAP